MMSGFRVAFDRLEAERLGRLPEFVLAGRAVGPIEASLHTIEIVGRGPRDDEVDKSRLEDQADSITSSGPIFGGLKRGRIVGVAA